jgi:hypothetical protein
VFARCLRGIRSIMYQEPRVNRICERCGHFIPREVIEHGLAVRTPAQYCSPECRRKARFARYVRRKAMALLRSGMRGFGPQEP